MGLLRLNQSRGRFGHAVANIRYRVRDRVIETPERGRLRVTFVRKWGLNMLPSLASSGRTRPGSAQHSTAPPLCIRSHGSQRVPREQGLRERPCSAQLNVASPYQH